MAGEKLDDKSVLAYLRARRAALDRAIAALEGKIGESAEILNGGGTAQQVQSDSFVGMNIATASVEYLRMAGRPARSTDEVHNALVRGGLPNFTRQSVATILQRLHNQGGDVVRASKGMWGLAEWYPNRPRPGKKNGKRALGGKKSATEKKGQVLAGSRRREETARSSTTTLPKGSRLEPIAVEWLRILRDAGTEGVTTAQLATGLGFDSGRRLSFLALRINKMLSGAKIDPKTVYEGRRVGKEQRWFAREKIKDALALIQG